MESRLALIVLIVAITAGCGGHSSGSPAASPSIPRAIANELATGADAVAASLDSGDACTATARATRLEQATQDAVSARRVPAVFQRKLLAAVDALVTAVPACPPQNGGENHDHGKHKGQDKHGGGD